MVSAVGDRWWWACILAGSSAERKSRLNTNILSSGLARIGLFTATLLVSVAASAVEVGDPAPDFVLSGSDGETHSLSDLRGQHVVIAFFPKAFTGG